MEFERLPTVPTADEILDRSLRRAAKKRKEKLNKDRANEEFVRAVKSAIHDRLVYIIRGFPEFDTLPRFYQEMADILFDLDRIRQSLGAVGWAAKHTGMVGGDLAFKARKSDDPLIIRRQAVARIASIVHQINDDLIFLNEVRNVLRKLPHIEDEFTVVIAGYPNVGKSSFIRLVSSATPEIASYPFTTKGVIVGHRKEGRKRIQFVDTPGILDRPDAERNSIERQALSAMMNVASVILFILDPTEHCGYPVDVQLRLLDEVKSMVSVPVITVANKSDLATMNGFSSMSTATKEGVDDILKDILIHYRAYEESHKPGQRPSDEKTEDSPPVEGGKSRLRPS